MPDNEVKQRPRPLSALGRTAGPLTGLLALAVLLAVLSPDFLTANNLLNVGVQASVVAVLAFGMTFVIVSGGIDLSVGSVAGLSGIVTGWAVAGAGLPLWLAIPVGLAAGAAAGLLSGVLITAGRVPPFIATLAMLSVARGLALVLADGRPISLDGWLAELGSGELFGFLPYPVLVMLAIGLLTAFVLRRTYAGRAMYAIGGNAEAARLSGIKVSRQKLLIYALSGLFAAVAGILLAARLASAQPEAGSGYELDAIAAVVIGGASLAGGVGSALGTFVGALVLAVLRNGLNLLDVSAFWQQVAIGAVIAVAVLFDTLRQRRRTGRRGALRTPAVRRAIAAVTALLVVAAGWAVYERQQGPADARLRIALSVSTLNNPFFVDVRAGAQAEADRLGVELSVTDAGEDASQQANAVQNAIARNADAIIVNPVDSDAVVPSVKAANDAGIPVVGVDRAPSAGTVVTTVASDNVTGGQLAARELVRLVGSGPVAVLEGKPGTSAARERGEGFTNEIRNHPQIQVVASQPADFERTKALDVMQNIMQSHPEVRGVFAANDEMALGAVKALGARAGTDVKVVGFDGTPEGLDAVRAGTESADVAQQPKLLGKAAVEQAVRAARDHNQGPGPATSIPVQVVTRETVEQFLRGQ
ncbi:monosaccharide ABC transporter substrate-binding protein (CUT2 family) /monosaccharide ABC transporter membrane protein (CUT2 family) [Saccharopolyspora erythraea NRRL 2338]|uniref:D-ribose ABC transporter permease protein n=2 Tax=Saccharopolyspora erythraea TaxID=1836 RepID=A4FLC1_SACEN|nr:substrate-binding domain-containing protein [Saccharopolyspora erythraea]EQD83789.1 sugar ABC transporter permease [Saccharopolyspora erythraea D]PFG98486.1 monosaccharide ABC transporter substrate-binding protein (CUT2 family) /monosaccharide ABC transporter membrane protein (CUT2 family) [Saccharopolyspora erythraea NRRL 2338]QRK88542.1 substrate-binding domain-containing protein [Saccharopolyspora erythraea]CAM04846.1 putative D-ribose ABC transporter permease protein [Saccharopolyspora e